MDKESFFSELEARLNKNLRFLQQHVPGAYAQVNKQGLHDIDVDLDESGEVLISIAGEVISQQRLRDETEAHIELLRTQTRPIFYAPHPLPRDVPEEYVMTDWDRLFFNPIDSKTRHRIHRLMSELLARGEQVDLIPNFGERTIPILLVFGTGHAYHVQRLLEEFDIWQLVLIDNDPGIARLFLCFADLEETVGRFLYGARPVARKAFSFIVSNDSKEILDLLSPEILQNFPPYFIHGAPGFYSIRDTRLSNEIVAPLTEWTWKTFRGWGFFDDEILSVRNTLRNVKAGEPYLATLPSVPERSAAFICGSGPSLDGLVDIIKQNRDQAVVFACGTAGGILYRHGILPDYHIEIERTETTTDTLVRDLPQEYLERVTLLSLSVVPSGSFSLFKKRIMLFRPNDAGTRVVQKALHQPPEFIAAPTVTNAGLDFALQLGFEDLYLCGVDLGFVDNQQHHSRSSIYFSEQLDDETDEGFNKLFKEITSGQYDNRDKLLTAKGNFRERVLTTDIFSLATTALEQSIAEHTAAKVYNLNDGAFVTGAIPLRPEAFQPLESRPTPGEVMAGVESAVRRGYKAPVLKIATEFRVAFQAYVKGVKGILAAAAGLEKREDLLVVLYRLYQFTCDQKAMDSPEGVLLRGSLLALSRLLYDYSLILAEDATMLAFSRQALQVISEHVDSANGSVALLLSELRETRA